jgi:streptomycin 6-kinase
VTDRGFLDRPPWGMSDGLAARMERVAREVAAEWGIPLGPRIASGRFSYVASAGEDALLKIIPPEDDGADHAADALEFWAGDGAVRLLRHDRQRRALLLERIRPGTEAAALSENEAIAAAISVGRRIWRTPPGPHPFRDVRDWVRRWMPADDHPLANAARRTFTVMQPRTDTLVHSDLHHHNLLLRDDAWVCIDPKPVVGEPEFDVPAFLWNPLSSASTRERTERRIRAFADAGLDGDLIRRWSIVRGVCDGFPLRPGEPQGSPQLDVVRQLL